MRPEESQPATKAKPAAAQAVAERVKRGSASVRRDAIYCSGGYDMPSANREAFCEAFRSQFGLKSNVSHCNHQQKHEAWIQAVMNEYA